MNQPFVVPSFQPEDDEAKDQEKEKMDVHEIMSEPKPTGTTGTGNDVVSSFSNSHHLRKVGFFH